MKIFHSVRAALDAGFTLYDRTAFGYVVRINTSAGLALALVVLDGSKLT